ncbi:MAG TPA: four-carbon acid sugar kinase family protein [Opitutaceae bacterium]|nr:four-carbon acid sugar kinase family protein [Opitutaceae bacterium]
MLRPPIVVIADDLTGAAEIAAIGHRHGLTASIISEFRPPQHQADLLVFDTDSRLDPPEIAAEKVRALGGIVAEIPRAFLYKKTDSVLRGAVRAELDALAHSVDQTRVLLVPANPALGRTVQNGHYAINGVPLHTTAFGRDPHHPARTSAVAELLGNMGSLPLSVIGREASPAPDGISVGDATSTSDVAGWARCATANPDLMLAGAAEFFSALLHERGLHAHSIFPPPAMEEPVLVISGTTSPAGVVLRQDANRARVPLLPIPAAALREPAAAKTAIQEWIEVVQARLGSSGHAVAVIDGPVLNDHALAEAIRRAFADLARELVTHRKTAHLIVEGGATAAAITRTLGWRELQVVHEWAPGVVSLRAGASGTMLTLKPGSYAWPAALWQTVISAGSKSFHP